MKPSLRSSCALLGCAAVLLTASSAWARCYGVSRAAYGRPAYVAPRAGAVVAGAAVADANDATWVAPYAPAPSGQTAPPQGVSPASVPAAVDVPMNGYVRTIPPNYKVVTYQGFTCYFVNNVYYRPIFYQGSTVYVVVTPSEF